MLSIETLEMSPVSVGIEKILHSLTQYHMYKFHFGCWCVLWLVAEEDTLFRLS